MSISDVLSSQSNFRSTRGRVPMWRFLLNNETMDVTPTDATLTFTDGAHDQAAITVTSDTLTTTDGIADQPISFSWGVAPRAELFVGYVTTVEVQSQVAQGALSFKMTILGPTKTMFEGTPRFWSRKSVPSAVRDLSYKNLLGFVGHDHTFLWSGLAQTNESDWTMINSLVKRLGWRVFTRYGVVMCYDPLKLFQDQGAYTRLRTGTPEDPAIDRYLLDFQPTELSDMIEAVMGTRYGYFDSGNRVQTISQPGDFNGYVFGTDAVIENQDAAQVYADAWNHNFDSWNQHALARIWGDADIYPGMAVEVITTNRRYLKTKYDGKWLVRGAAHQMDRQNYQTQLYLSRPDSSTPVGDTPYVPFWKQGTTSQARPFLSISEGRWVSSWTDRRYVSLLT